MGLRCNFYLIAGLLLFITGCSAVGSPTSTESQTQNQSTNPSASPTPAPIPDPSPTPSSSPSPSPTPSPSPSPSPTTSGVAQFPTLLSAYAIRPSWNVPGVDYQVGVPTNITLQDPTTGTLPSCASYSASSHAITINANNCTLNGYDFTKGGGIQVSIPSGVTGTVIENCLFGLNGNPSFSTSLLDRRGGDLTVMYSTFQGPGQDPAYFDSGASGTVTFEYDYFYNLSGDAMDFGSTQTVNVEYNACVQIGLDPESHPDCVQYCGGTLGNTSHESYNLIYQPAGAGTVGTQGIQAEIQCGGTISQYSIDHNTVIANDPGDPTMSYSIMNNGGSGVSITDNYIDSTGAYGPFYPAGTATCDGNIALTSEGEYTSAGQVNWLAGADIAGTFDTMTCQ